MTGLSARALLASLRSMPGEVPDGSVLLPTEGGWQAIAVPDGATLEILGQGLVVIRRSLTPEQWEAACATTCRPVGGSDLDEGDGPPPPPGRAPAPRRVRRDGSF